MRARPGRLLGGLLVLGWAAALTIVVVTTPHRQPPTPDGRAAEALVQAWERSRQATVVRSGTFERRRPATGAAITSEDVLAQRPPARLHRQLGSVEVRDDAVRTTCAAAIGGQSPPPCRTSESARGYQADVAAEVASLRALVTGEAALYSVTREEGCFDLRQGRPDPRAPFGVEARFCFDDLTGAPIDSRVRYEGGVEEVITVLELRSEVTDADLRP